MKILIKNGRVIDPASNIDEVLDILIKDNIIEKVEKNITDKVDQTINADGNWVTPGLIDIHVHLREPGFTHKETIKTGTQSAALGGFTTICPMPNTNPVTDNETVIKFVIDKANSEGAVNVLPVGAITVGQKGEELTDIDKMVQAGACAISEDGKEVVNAGLMKKAFESAKKNNIPVLSHCEDRYITGKGQMNAGERAKALGLEGISNDSEEVIVSRDIILARGCDSKVHICHISTRGSVQLVREAKARQEKVSAEVAPHHFTLSDEDILSRDTNFKMSPPLRSKKDVLAIKDGLRDGTIDVIATDHAPHDLDSKNCDFEKAANGIVGLETSISLCITELVEKGVLTPIKLIEKMTINPAKILNIEKGTLQIGKIADITIINPTFEYKIDASEFASKSKNSPFDGFLVRGKVLYTIVNGKIIVSEGKLI